jgi:bifunctional oligoribonuclease and PAP phosphatase NrnA
MKTNLSIHEVAAQLKAAQKILIISHTSPDADAYGSSCGLALALRTVGKDVVCLNESVISQRLSFIPGVTQTVREIPTQGFDLHCVVDCGELKRVGDNLKEYVGSLHPLLNIDHHISNDYFADMNYVVPDASSTSELIYLILKEAAIPLTADIASALFTGITGDTGSFRYSSTTAQVFSVAEALVKAGARPDKISQDLYSRVRRQSVQVCAAAMSKMEFFADGRCAWIVVPRELAERYGAEREDTEGLVERGRDIEGVLVAAFLREEEGMWKVSLRSKDAQYNVAQIAARFAGGGHMMAAAFRWKNSFQELSDNLQAALIELFK